MKKMLLQTSLTALLALLAVGLLSAQQDSQTTTTTPGNNVVIVQKTKNEDGTVSVKKTFVAKGENIENVWKVFNLENNKEGVQEVTVHTGKDVATFGENAETVIFIRSGKDVTEVKWNDTDALDQFHGKDLLLMQPKFDKHNLALIGDAADGQRPLLGIYPGDEEGKGVLVDDIVPGGGAEAAGILAGDLIVQLGETVILNRSDLHEFIGSRQVGDEVKVVFVRNGQRITTTAELKAQAPKRHAYRYSYTFNDYERNPCKVFIGVQLGSWDDGERGVGVSGIISGWPAEAAGLKAGDRIVSLDGVEVNTHTELVVERDKHKPGDYFTIGYLRDGKVSKVKAQFKECPTDAKVEGPQQGEELVEEVPVPPTGNALQLGEFNAYPNPTAGELNVTFRGEAVPTTVTVTDITGKVIHSESLPNFDGYYNRQLDVSKGTPGTLMLSVRQNEQVQTKPILLLNRA